jgi:hypothetical protein
MKKHFRNPQQFTSSEFSLFSLYGFLKKCQEKNYYLLVIFKKNIKIAKTKKIPSKSGIFLCAL